MDLVELIELTMKHTHPYESFVTILAVIFTLFCTIIQISPIKINPWDKMLGWIGDRFNSGMNKKIEKIDDRINSIEKDLNEHIKDSAVKDLKEQRRYIINFVNEGLNDAEHSRESFEDVIKSCDEYEEYIIANNLQNGVITGSINAIRKKYEEHLLANDFPPEEISAK